MSSKKTVQESSLKYGKMEFKDFWKKYKNSVNKEVIEEYNKASRFKRFFMEKENTLLNQEWVKIVARHFFERGRLQMIASINMKEKE